jgi:hypothetical protein
LAAEQREEAAAFAAHLARLGGEPVELALLAIRRVLVAFDLFGAHPIDIGAIDGGELRFEADADRIARAGWLHARPRRRRLRGRSGERRGKHERGRDEPSQWHRDDCLNHGAEPHPETR